jgi:hypothetical protein
MTDTKLLTDTKNFFSSGGWPDLVVACEWNARFDRGLVWFRRLLTDRAMTHTLTLREARRSWPTRFLVW